MKIAQLLFVSAFLQLAALAAEKPNIVYIMSDELAYFELGHMGNPYLKTPRIDQMAKEGIRFTHAYAASPVCAPLRCNLMTGKHAGHASVRANDGGTPLRAGEVTIASILKAHGYATGGFGKWGCGGRDSTGVPEKHGFDTFFGYYDQVHAHSFYPPYLVRNSEEVTLEGNIGGRKGETYSHYEIMRDGLDFIRENKGRPFFCYLPITPPHGMYDIPSDDPAWELYSDAPWMRDPNLSQEIKNYAAMVSMVDRNVGEVIDLLKELGLEDDTIVFFTGDNGGQDRFRSKDHPRGFFMPNKNPETGVEFRGGKGNLYEGGLRIPFMVRWPGKIKAGQVSDLRFYQPDVLPTLAEISGAKAPDDIDGISFLPTLIGGEQREHEFFYWEYGNQVAARIGEWKAIQNRKSGTWALYDLEKDISETNDVAKAHPQILAKLVAVAKREHTEARPGTYTDPTRARHERDRKAKWGTSPDAPKPRKKKPVKKSAVRLDEKNLVPAEQMKLAKVSSENLANDKRGAYAIDGDPDTIWHSRFTGGPAKHPHELVIDLGASHKISGFRYLARQDEGWNGAFAETQFFVAESADGFSDSPAAAATFKKVKAVQRSECEGPVSGRYVRVRVLSEVNGALWASAAEIGVIGVRR